MRAHDSNLAEGQHQLALVAPSGFPDEKTLHTLVEEALHILPLAGSPQLVIVGREVQLGNGYADLVAIEPAGRLAVIEVKLARNAEARRAGGAQVLTYAAYLKGLTPSILEQAVLASHLRNRGYQDLAQAVTANDQEGSFDPTAFAEGLADSLARGRFRVVFVLDDAPQELVRLVGYLESVTDGLVIDLISVSAYDINGSQVLVPQRVEDERQPTESARIVPLATPEGRLVEGAADFAAAIDQAPATYRVTLRHLCKCATALERDGLCKLYTYHGKAGLTLLPRLVPENVGLVTIYNSNGAYLQFWRSVFECHAPNTLSRVEAGAAPTSVGRGNWTSAVPDDLLVAITAAYREAAGQSDE